MLPLRLQCVPSSACCTDKTLVNAYMLLTSCFVLLFPNAPLPAPGLPI
jgi:hypothetical protein